MLARSYDQWLRSHVGYSLAFFVFCLLPVVPIVSAEDKTDELQVKALPGIPEDFLLIYGTGATHANRINNLQHFSGWKGYS